MYCPFPHTTVLHVLSVSTHNCPTCTVRFHTQLSYICCPCPFFNTQSRLRLKCDDPRAEIRFRLSVKRTSPFKSAGASVHSTTGSRVVRISGSNSGYTMFRGSVKSTGNPLHSPVSPSLPLPCVTVRHHISAGLYLIRTDVLLFQFQVQVLLLTETMKTSDKAQF
jgi:hypothetical protein